jgi:hypothetical protein
MVYNKQVLSVHALMVFTMVYFSVEKILLTDSACSFEVICVPLIVFTDRNYLETESSCYFFLEGGGAGRRGFWNIGVTPLWKCTFVRTE